MASDSSFTEENASISLPVNGKLSAAGTLSPFHALYILTSVFFVVFHLFGQDFILIMPTVLIFIRDHNLLRAMNTDIHHRYLISTGMPHTRIKNLPTWSRHNEFRFRPPEIPGFHPIAIGSHL